jgi:hypothetical protein
LAKQYRKCCVFMNSSTPLFVAGDLDSHRFDLLIHMENEKKQQTKYAYLQPVETHSCLGSDANDDR